MNDAPGGRAHPSTQEAFWPTDLFSQGLGWVIIARFKAQGQRVQAGVLLADVFCLGAKLAVYEDCDREDYRPRIRDHYQSRFPMVSVEPCCARKLVEQAVQYAQRLGLAPHPDYKKAARVFGGVQAAQCAQQFTFGCRGKPFYRRGPRETEARSSGYRAPPGKALRPGSLRLRGPAGRGQGHHSRPGSVELGGVSRLPLTLHRLHRRQGRGCHRDGPGGHGPALGP